MSTQRDYSEAMQLSTIIDFIRYSFTELAQSEVFYGHGTDNAWDEAMSLVYDLLALPVDIDQSLLRCQLTETEKHRLCDGLDKRINQRIPLAYITQKTRFAGIDFYIDERALIPRSPVAELIESHFTPWLSEPPTRILDMCTGGGCIALAAAIHMPEAEVVGVDISADALAVAAINLNKHQLADRVQFIESDVYQSLDGQRFDVIVSNPPYVDAYDMDNLPQEFTHEPTLALESGQDGLDCSRIILAQAAEHLNDGGIVILEVGNSAPALEQAFPELPMVWIELERGGHGVCVIDKSDLINLTL